MRLVTSFIIGLWHCLGNTSYRIPLAKLLRYEECFYRIKFTQDFPLAYKIGVYKIVTTTELASMEKSAPKIVRRRHKNMINIKNSSRRPEVMLDGLLGILSGP